MAKRRNHVREQPPVDPAEAGRVSERTNALKLDAFAHGPLVEIMERFKTRLLEEARTIAGGSIIEASHLEEAFRRLTVPLTSQEWSVLNRRRVYLIQKEVAGEISTSEAAELESLQAQADQRMSQVAPRPLEFLWDLKRQLLEQGGREGESGEPA